MELIHRNPCAALNPRTDLPKSQRKERVFALTFDQACALAEAIDGPYGALVHFAARTGLRAGECGALRMENLNTLTGNVHVVESLSEVSGKLHYVRPKNGRSRTLVMPRYLRELMREYLSGQPAKGPADLVFTAPAGGPLVHHHFYEKWFRPAMRRAGLPASTTFQRQPGHLRHQPPARRDHHGSARSGAVATTSSPPSTCST